MSRPRRLRDGRAVVFDYKTLLDKKGKRDKVLLRMVKGPVSYETPEGVKYWSEHPFQWVSEEEAAILKGIKTGFVDFRDATLEDVEDYYALD